MSYTMAYTISFAILTLFLTCARCEPQYPDNKSPITCPPPEDPSLFDLPDRHIGVLLSRYPKTIEYYCDYCPLCIREKRDLYMHHFDMWYPRPCWGYESYNCDKHQHFLPMPHCVTERSQKLRKQQKVQQFYKQADFGYIQKILDERFFICWPDPRGGYDAWLQCNKHLQFCSGYMVRIDFRALSTRDGPVRYHMDVLKAGEISENIYV